MQYPLLLMLSCSCIVFPRFVLLKVCPYHCRDTWRIFWFQTEWRQDFVRIRFLSPVFSIYQWQFLQDVFISLKCDIYLAFIFVSPFNYVLLTKTLFCLLDELIQLWHCFINPCSLWSLLQKILGFIALAHLFLDKGSFISR